MKCLVINRIVHVYAKIWNRFIIRVSGAGQEFRKRRGGGGWGGGGGGVGGLVQHKICSILKLNACMNVHAHNVYSPLSEVWVSAKYVGGGGGLYHDGFINPTAPLIDDPDAWSLEHCLL